MYSISYMAQLTSCHLQKLILVNILNAFETVIYTFQNMF